MNASQGEGGKTLRETLESVWETTGEKPPELIEVELPGSIAHVWKWFTQLHRSRRMGAMAPDPITYQDILAWSMVTGTAPSPFEVDCIMDADSVWLSSKR